MKKLLILIAFLTGLSSCVVERPSHSGISTYHKENNIKSVGSPNYKKKLSMSGITFQIGATAGGAVAGMALSPTTFYGSDNKSTTNVVLNGVIGGAVGYGITSLMYVIQGQGKKRSMQPNKFPQWLDEYNRRHIGKEYVFTGFTNYSGYLVLPNNSKTENNYTASNVEQAIMFKNAFPYSSRNAAFETQAANRIYTQSDAALFLTYYPNSIYKNSVRQKLQKMEADIAARENARKQAQIENSITKGLMIGGAVLLGGWLIKKGLEGIDFSSSGGGSYDDNYSNRGSSSDDEDAKRKAEKEKLDKQMKEDIERGNIIIPTFKLGQWETISSSYHQIITVQFSKDKDNETHSGKIDKFSDKSKPYAVDHCRMAPVTCKFYYSNLDNAIKALYIYEKYNILMKE